MDLEEKKSRFEHPVKQWAKAVIWCILYIFFIVWVGTYGWLILLPLIFDAFITRYIPWTWWKKSKNKTVVMVMGWVDAIVFALVAVYFINTYLFQNYQIPSSSLEKTLLVGDFLFVSKASYGPRVPNTPLSFPLVQHTFPMLNCKSFIESPQWDYKRLQGFDTIKRYDIVVFNFPAGDTVMLADQTEDYEGVCYRQGFMQATQTGEIDRFKKMSAYESRNNILSLGRQLIKSNPGLSGGLSYRPVDRRENYVKRCVGLPGEFLAIRNRELYINNKLIERPEGAQHLCLVKTDRMLTQAEFDKLELSQENTAGSLKDQKENQYIYILALTKGDQDKLKQLSGVIKVEENNFNNFISDYPGQYTYPAGYSNKWTVDNYGPIWIPKAGKTVELTVGVLPIYERCIRVYEHNKLEVKNNIIYINDKATNRYTFKMNYYWMMGDNRHNSADSRIWGFVPEDHVVGRPVFVWLSLNKDKTLFDGKIRFNRIFKNAEK